MVLLIQLLMLALHPLPSVLSTWQALNTRIGWPWDYLGHGFWATVGFTAVCILVFFGYGELCAKKDGRKNVFGALIWWLLAGILLQALPHTTSGLQFIPLPPWHYGGWIAKIVSVACWLTLGFVGSLIFFSPVKDDHEWAARVLLVALGLNALLSFAGPADAAVASGQDGCPAFVESCQGKIEQWEKLRDERQEALRRLAFDHSALIARINGLRVTTKQELMAHAVGRTLAEELEQLCGQIGRLQNETDAIEAVLERAKSMVRRIEREAMLQGLGVATEGKYDQLNELDHQLQEELRKIGGPPVPGSQVRIDKVLDGLFHR